MAGELNVDLSEDEKVAADLDTLEDEGEVEDKPEGEDEPEGESEDEPEDEPEDDKVDEDDEEEDEEEEKEDIEEKPEEKVDETLKLGFSEIKKKYPNFFKEFPQFRGIVAQHHQFTKLFPSVEEAEAAAEIVENHSNVAEAIFSGQSDKFLAEIKEANSEGFGKFVNNILPALFSVDEKAYFKITTPIVENVLRSVYQDGLNLKETNTINSAIIAYAKTFGVSIEKAKETLNKNPEAVSDKKDPEREKLDKDREDFFKQKFTDLNTKINNDINTVLNEEFVKGVGELSVLEKKAFISECYRLLVDELSKDKVHSGRMSALWKKEQKAGFTGANADSIKTAALSRAKASIPVIRAKVKAEMAKKPVKKDSNLKDKNRHVPSSSGGGKGGSKITNRTNPKSVDYSKTSDMDIINDGAGGHVKFRG